MHHPQTNGLVKKFNQTLKWMLTCVIMDGGWDWDLLLAYVLFAMEETPKL